MGLKLIELVLKRSRGLSHGLKNKGLKVHSSHYNAFSALKNYWDNKGDDGTKKKEI